MLVEHVRRPVYRRIDKSVKKQLDQAVLALAPEDGAAIKRVLRNATDQDYLATLVAFVPEETNTVLIGYAQCVHDRLIPVIDEDGEVSEIFAPGDIFTRRKGVGYACSRAIRFAEKNQKDNTFLPGENKYLAWHLPSHVLASFPRFMARAKRYYKDKKFIPWAVHAYEIITKQKF